jgi:hypothetical protein
MKFFIFFKIIVFMDLTVKVSRSVPIYQRNHCINIEGRRVSKVFVYPED